MKMVHQSKPSCISQNCFSMIDNCLVDDELKCKFGVRAWYEISLSTICKNIIKRLPLYCSLGQKTYGTNHME